MSVDEGTDCVRLKAKNRKQTRTVLECFTIFQRPAQFLSLIHLDRSTHNAGHFDDIASENSKFYEKWVWSHNELRGRLNQPRNTDTSSIAFDAQKDRETAVSNCVWAAGVAASLSLLCEWQRRIEWIDRDVERLISACREDNKLLEKEVLMMLKYRMESHMCVFSRCQHKRLMLANDIRFWASIESRGYSNMRPLIK